jgi:SPP1 family predicted phage head-tail adaptor
MQAGALDRTITIREEGLIDDGYGGTIPGGWQDLATVAAHVKQQTGREFIQAQQVTAERRVVFTIRFRAGITTAMQIRYDGTEFNIREVREIGRRQWLELHTESVE